MIGLLLSLLEWVGLSPISYLASVVGATEPALKLMLSILLAYPISIIYLEYVQKKDVRTKHFYFIFTGLDLGFYNFGFSIYHNAIPVLVLYITTMFLTPGKNNVIFTFVFNMAYLLTGYFMTESEDYDITWTMPHCVLTLKLIALSFDIWDGEKLLAGEELSSNNKKTALVEKPTLIELIGFAYFPACYLVGPMFSFKRYSNFINTNPKNPIFPLQTGESEFKDQGFKKLLQGLLYLAAFQVGVSVFSMKFILSDEFWNTSIFYRHFYCGMWAHFALYKYISCWLLTEASCIRVGFSYNGTEKSADGRVVTKWDGCNNIKILRFEGATKFQHYIDSFNCNTNHFAAEYIYKRLKFLGNRNISQFSTLFFLAVWHGIRSGYYMTFFNEFIIIYFEKGLESTLSKTELYHKIWNNSIAKCILYALLKSYTIVFMGWSLVPFDVKVISKWWSVYHSLYYSGFLLFLPWEFVYKPGLWLVIKKLKLSMISDKKDKAT